MPPPRYLLGLDVETSGMGVRRNFLVQIGLALVDTDTESVVAEFQSYVGQPPGTEWEPRCVNEFWSKHPELYQAAKDHIKNAPSSTDVAAALLTWVRDNVKDPQHTRLVVDTPGFDTAWLDMLLGDRSHQYLLTDPETHQPMFADVLDVSSWYLGLGQECDPDASSKKTSLRAIGEEQEPELGTKHTHEAAKDAANTAMRAAWVMKRVKRARTN